MARDPLKDAVSGLANAEPATQIVNGVKKVGQLASDAYDSAKDYVGKKLASPPPPADIALPSEKKKSVTRAVTRSMSKR
jgi:hypothetical protein